LKSNIFNSVAFCVFLFRFICRQSNSDDNILTWSVGGAMMTNH